MKYLLSWMTKSALLSIFVCIDASAATSTLADNKDALAVIQQFAEGICGHVPLSGQETKVDLSVEAKAKLSKALKKVADLGGEGAARYQKNSFQGVLQKDLAALVKNSTDCRLAVARDLQSKLLSPVIVESKERNRSTMQASTISPKEKKIGASVKFPIVAEMFIGQTRTFFDGFQLEVVSAFGSESDIKIDVRSTSMGAGEYSMKVGSVGPIVYVNGREYKLTLPRWNNDTSQVTVRIERVAAAPLSEK